MACPYRLADPSENPASNLMRQRSLTLGDTSDNFLLTESEPWEIRAAAMGTVLHDPNGVYDNKPFVMLYTARTASGQNNLAVAVSDDGENWTKPDLGLETHNGQPTNILLRDTVASSGQILPNGDIHLDLSILDGSFDYYETTVSDLLDVPTSLVRKNPSSVAAHGFEEGDIISTIGGQEIVKLNDWSGGTYTRRYYLGTSELQGLGVNGPTTKGGLTFIDHQSYGLSILDTDGLVDSIYRYIALDWFFGITQDNGGSQKGEIWPVWVGSDDLINWNQIFGTQDAIPKPAYVGQGNMLIPFSPINVVGNEIWVYWAGYPYGHNGFSAVGPSGIEGVGLTKWPLSEFQSMFGV